MPCYSFSGLVPVVASSAFVHPTAVLIGDVWVGEGCYVGPSASLRGDFGRVVIEDGGNVQDNCVLHSFPGADCVVERDGHVGHAAVLHGCRIGRNALVGISAVVMDKAVIGTEAIVGAMSFVKSGLEIPPRVLVVGNPARVIRRLTEKEVIWKTQGTQEYQALARVCLDTVVEIQPLATAEPARPRLRGDYRPLGDTNR
jgi:phenylacetic acid degradation protein